MISRLFQDVDAPRLDLGAQARLRRLDTRLAVTFSQYAIDPLTSQPLDADREAGGGPVVDPAWHLWIKNPDHGWLLVRSYYVARGEWFGHQQIAALEQDLMRTHSPGEILQLFAQRRDSHARRARAARDQEIADIGRANKRRISDLISDNKSGRRTRKLASYAGQHNRSTPSETFLPEAREDGWELPETA